MKLCYPITTPDCTIPMMAFSCGSFENHLAAIKECGYDGIELLIRDPYEADYEKIRQMIEDAGLKVGAIATSPMPSEDKIFLASDDPEVRKEAMKRAEEMIKWCGRFQAPLVIGRFRGNINPDNEENSMEALTECFRKLNEWCKAYGGTIALEVQNKNNVNTFNTAKETVSWINRTSFDRIGLLLDTFHMELTESSFGNAMKEAEGKLEFVHLSDIRRLVPGAGTISFKEVLALLEMTGYRGWLSVEVKQSPDSRTVADLTARYLKYLEAAEV